MAKSVRYSVDKLKSLEIMQELISHFKNKNDVMYHQSVDLYKKNGGNEIDYLNMIRLGRDVYCNHHDEDEKYTDNHITSHRHSLKIIELEIGDDAIDGEISNYYDEIFDFENDNRTGEEDIYVEFSGEDTQVEIYCHDTEVSDDSIKLHVSFEQTDHCLNPSKRKFRYDSTLQCWILVNDETGGGIDRFGMLIILDFSDYLR